MDKGWPTVMGNRLEIRIEIYGNWRRPVSLKRPLGKIHDNTPGN